MGRPRGSKNKKTLNSAAQNDNPVSGLEERIDAMKAELAELISSVDEQKKMIMAKKRDIRKAETQLKHLKEKKEKEDSAAAAIAAKAQISQVVDKLIAGGMSADEILKKINEA